jgi:hypothetical protein
MKKCLFALVIILVLIITTGCSGKTQPSISPTETFVPGTGRVTGVLQVGSGGSQPVKDVVLYLAGTVKDNSGNDSFAALDRVNSPRTIADDQGRFIFTNVPTGKYGLVLDLIMNSYLLLKPGTQDNLLIEVSAGQQIDLGTLLYDSLPLPSQP